MKIKKYIITPLLLSTVWLSGCVNTNVNMDVTKKSEIEMLDLESIVSDNKFSDYVSDYTFDDFNVADEDVIGELKNRMSNYLVPEQIIDRPIQKDDCVHLRTMSEYEGKLISNNKYLEGDYFLNDDSLPSFISSTIIGMEPQDNSVVSCDFTVNADEVIFESTGEKLSHDNYDVTATCYIVIDYIVGERNFPEDADSVVAEYTSHKYESYDSYYDAVETELIGKKKSEIFYSILEDMYDKKALIIKSDIEVYERIEKNILEFYYTNVDALNENTFAPAIETSDSERNIEDYASQLARDKILFYYIAWLNDWKLSDDKMYELIKARTKVFGFATIPQAVNVYGSDLLRWEAFKNKFQESFFKIYIKDYVTQDTQTTDEATDGKNINGIVLKEKHI